MCSISKGETGGCGQRQSSVPSEGNILESINPRRHVLRIIKLRLRSGVFADAACAVKRGHVSRQAAADDALARQTGNIGNARKRRAVLANGRVGRKRVCAATTFCGRTSQIRQFECGSEAQTGQALTTFKIISSVDTLPRTRTTSKDAAGCPRRSHLCARVDANPTPLLANCLTRGA